MSYVGGIDNIKILISLRIYGNKWHVYSGLAIMNPSAQLQIDQYGNIKMLKENHLNSLNIFVSLYRVITTFSVIR